MSAVNRLVDRLGNRVDVAKSRVASGTGYEDLFRLTERVESLEEAVAENSLLAARLADQVTDLERLLIGPLEKRHDVK